jgi:hypothetical protein
MTGSQGGLSQCASTVDRHRETVHMHGVFSTFPPPSVVILLIVGVEIMFFLFSISCYTECR